jgi:hypothetical protein
MNCAIFKNLSPHHFKIGHCGRLLSGHCTATGTQSECGLVLLHWNMLLAVTLCMRSEGLVESRRVTQGLTASRSGVPEHTCIFGTLGCAFRVFDPHCDSITILRKVCNYLLNNAD